MIRKITPDDWRELRDIRIEALEESPYAFGATLDESLALSEESWKEAARRYSCGPDSCFFFAFHGTAPIGMAGCFRDRKRDRVGHVNSFWIMPGFRGTGLAEKIMMQIQEWAEENGLTALEGYVTENNPRARAFYIRIGFYETDERINLRWNPSVEEILIRKVIGANRAAGTNNTSDRHSTGHTGPYHGGAGGFRVDREMG